MEVADHDFSSWASYNEHVVDVLSPKVRDAIIVISFSLLLPVHTGHSLCTLAQLNDLLLHAVSFLLEPLSFLEESLTIFFETLLKFLNLFHLLSSPLPVSSILHHVSRLAS